MVSEQSLNQISRPAKAPARRPRRHPGFYRFVGRLALGVLLAIAAVSRFAVAAGDGYALDQLQAQIAVARGQETSLESQIAQLTSAARLSSIAARLQMAPAPAAMTLQMPSAPAATASPRRLHATGGIIAALRALIGQMTRVMAKL